jgi:glycosyltransferase involved in cell wall biosynthesis
MKTPKKDQAYLNNHSPKARILQIGNYPPPICGWAIHTQAVHRALTEAGAASQVLDLGPGRRISERECLPVANGFDYVKKVIASRVRGYTFEIHINGDTWKRYLLALTAAAVGCMTGKPAVLMFHAGPKQLYFPRNRGFWFHAFRWLFQMSGEIICNLESVKTAILGYGIPAQKVHAIFSVQYHPEQIPVPLPEPVGRFLEAHEPRLFSYTLFRPEFTMDCLFEAFAQIRREFPRAGLLIVGPPEVPADARASMRLLGVESSVLVAGNLPRAEFLTAIKSSDVFVRTHLRDGLCSSVLEALNLRVPVVAAEDGIRPPSVITYAPADTADLTRALLHVLSNLETVRAQVQPPELHNSLDEEVSLLLSVATRATP